MTTTTVLKELTLDTALQEIDSGTIFVDLCETSAYLDAHVPTSIALRFEAGPGLASRARDCLPLDLRLILLDHGDSDVPAAAASLRGKGFAVVGSVPDGINEWARSGKPLASTEVVRGPTPPKGTIVDVADPGTIGIVGGTRVPVETLWARRAEVARSGPIVIAAGFGVRAALAVGMLESAGARDVVFWKTRP